MSKQDKALLTCPRCGHQQAESRAAFSAACKNCGQYWRVQDLLKPVPKAAPAPPAQRRISCFDCATEFDAPANAQSTMCKKCSRYIDLQDYSISSAVSKNFKTKGSFVIEPTGYVFNSEATVAEAAIKGRFIGKLIVEGSLTLYSSAQIKGSLSAARFILPAGQHFRWDGEIKVGSAEIAGELVANIDAQCSVHVSALGRVCGNLKAKSLTADRGAILAVKAFFGGPEAQSGPSIHDRPLGR